MHAEVENVEKRLLFVDDEEGIRVTLPPILRARGFDVTVAASVPEAIDKIQNQRFDLLLSDLNIGGPGDGFTLVRAIRQINPQCVTIILTGYPGVESAVQGVRERVDDYLIKPADINSLIASLEAKLVQRRRRGGGAHLFRISSVVLSRPSLSLDPCERWKAPAQVWRGMACMEGPARVWVRTGHRKRRLMLSLKMWRSISISSLSRKLRRAK